MCEQYYDWRGFEWITKKLGKIFVIESGFYCMCDSQPMELTNFNMTYYTDMTRKYNVRVKFIYTQFSLNQSDTIQN